VSGPPRAASGTIAHLDVVGLNRTRLAADRGFSAMTI